MQEYVNVNGKKKVVRFESYAARREVIDEIIQFAEGSLKDGKRRAKMIWKPNYDKVHPVVIFEEKTGLELAYYPLTVVWREEAYISGGDDSAYRKFSDYEV